MLDGRFDPALAALFAGEDADFPESPSQGVVIAGSLLMLTLGALSWTVLVWSLS